MFCAIPRRGSDRRLDAGHLSARILMRSAASGRCGARGMDLAFEGLPRDRTTAPPSGYLQHSGAANVALSALFRPASRPPASGRGLRLCASRILAEGRAGVREGKGRRGFPSPRGTSWACFGSFSRSLNVRLEPLQSYRRRPHASPPMSFSMSGFHAR